MRSIISRTVLSLLCPALIRGGSVHQLLDFHHVYQLKSIASAQLVIRRKFAQQVQVTHSAHFIC